MTLWKWSQTAASNGTADGTIGLSEGQTPGSLNDAARAMMAAAAKYRDDMAGKNALGGTALAYTLTTNMGITALQDGLHVAARIANTNTSVDVTLAVDGTAAKAVFIDTDGTGTKPPVGMLRKGAILDFVYNASLTAWIVKGIFTPNALIETGTLMMFVQTSAPTGWTKDTTHNNKALRVVSGTAGSGGSIVFSTVFSSRAINGSVGATTLSTAQMPTHTHDYEKINNTGLGATGGGSIADSRSTVATTSAGSGNSHIHSVSITNVDMSVQYVDVIIATKD